MTKRSISVQLTAWYAGLLMATLVVLGAFLYLGMKHHLLRNLRQTQLRRAEGIAQTIVARIPTTGEGRVSGEISERYAPELNSRFIRILRPDGSPLYSSGIPSDLSFNPAEVPLPQGPVSRTTPREQVLPSGQRLFVVGLPVPAPGGGQYLVEVGTSMTAVQEVLGGWMLTMALSLPVVITVATVGGWVLARRAFAPFEKIIRSAEQLTSQNLSGRLPVPRTGDELERLSTALNHMLSRLDDALQCNRRFMADASHELRTPLTVCRGIIETLHQQADGAPELQERIAEVSEELGRLSRIVEHLFALSRLDAGEAHAESVRFDLCHLAVTTSDQMALLAEDKGVTVECVTRERVLVEGDRARLKQVVVNLLDNAIKYTPSGGRVVLSIDRTRAGAVLEVSDSGIGIPAEALQHVFERFYRVDKARSREMGGAGIGLAIVKAICSAHGGRVAVHSDEGRGSRFTVTLPLADSSNEFHVHSRNN